MLPEEQQIIEKKYASKPFGLMSLEELFISVHVLLTKLQVITGWNVPPDEKLTILIDQLTKKFTESYQTVNADEMEFAFRNNLVKDWGKNMNLNLIDEVMAPYLQKRKELSRMEEEKASKFLELPEPEITDQDFIESIKNLYEKTNDWRLIPAMAYEILCKEGKINLSLEDKKEIKQRIDGAYPETPEAEKKNLCKSYSVMQYFIL